MALNFWFKGLGHALTECPSHMRVYYLRALCHSMLQAARADTLRGSEEGAASVSPLTRSKRKRPCDSDLKVERLREVQACLEERGPEKGVDAVMDSLEIEGMRDLLLALTHEQLYTVLKAMSPRAVEVMISKWEKEALNANPIS